MTSPQRIAWLRGEVAGYMHDMAARAYFRLPCWAMDQEILDPKQECVSLCANLAAKHGLTEQETLAAFQAEWKEGLELSQKLGEKLRIIALSHIKMCGSSAGLLDSFMAARRNFPEHWPHLTYDNLEAIAGGFARPAKRRA